MRMSCLKSEIKKMASKIDLTNDGYDSDLEEPEPKKTWRSDPLARKERKKVGLPDKKFFRDEVDAAARRIGRYNGFMAMDAYSRHKQFINYYCLHYTGKEHFVRDRSRDRNDYDVLAENHRFLWDEEDEDDDARLSWERQLAKKYYNKLFKEYCIADLSLFKENRVAMRWRVEREVLDGKGQFVCGEKRCQESADLQSWEVNFGYMEHGVKKNALVKLRLCRKCSEKLNYHHKHKQAKQERQLRRAEKRKRKAQERETEEKHGNDHSAEESVSGKTSDAAYRAEAMLASLSKDIAQPTLTSPSSASPAEPKDNPADIWKKPVQVEVEKTREEEFDDYFQDMFL